MMSVLIECVLCLQSSARERRRQKKEVDSAVITSVGTSVGKCDLSQLSVLVCSLGECQCLALAETTN